MKYKNIFLFLTPLVVWLLCQMFLLKPNSFYFAIALGIILILVSVAKFLKKSSKRNWFNFLISPILFFLSLSFYSTVLTNRFWIQVIFIFIAWFIFNYLRNLSNYIVDNNNDNTERLDNTLLIGGFLSIFASSAFLYTMPAFLNWSLWKILVFFIPIAFLLFNQFLSIRNINFRTNGSMIILDALVLVEIFWALSLLPLNFNILGCLLAIFYYLLFIVNRLHWRDSLNLKNVKIPLVLATVVLILLLLTARWL